MVDSMALPCGRRWADGHLGTQETPELQEGVWEPVPEGQESDDSVHTVESSLVLERRFLGEFYVNGRQPYNTRIHKGGKPARTSKLLHFVWPNLLMFNVLNSMRYVV